MRTFSLLLCALLCVGVTVTAARVPVHAIRLSSEDLPADDTKSHDSLNAHDASSHIGSSEQDLELHLSVDGYTNAAKEDQILKLPGYDKHVPFRQFSGYLEVDKATKRNIFYWFTESEKDPENAPVLFWTNGGPGCSGLLGFLTEQGAFRVTRDGQSLTANPYAWNKEVNIFFVEQPAGVGFSYSEDPAFYDGIGDTLAAQDNYRVILKFFEKFPQYKKNDFFISSESYGGHYIPTLAKEIVDQQKTASPEDKINFAGLLVGNPYNNPDENAIGMIQSFWGRQLVPKNMVDEWFKKCELKTHVCPMWSQQCKSGSRHVHNSSELRECEQLESDMKDAVGDLNPYGLDWPVCNDPITRHGRAQRHALLSRVALARGHSHHPDERFLPCEEEYSMVYLNRADVQAAIHAYLQPSAGKWTECANHHHLKYNETELSVDMSAYWRYLLDGGFNLKLLIYSGDADSVCATAGTQTWLGDLGYPVVDKWKAWEVDEQVAGYATKFEGFSFVTVHNAGHEVPSYQPRIALTLLKRFLAGDF